MGDKNTHVIHPSINTIDERRIPMPGLILPYLDHMPRLAADIFIADGAVVIGDVELGEGVNIWFNAVLRGDMNSIRVGANSNVQDGVVVHVHSDGLPTTIGANVTIGHHAIIHACTLEDGCLIGMGACVLDGAVVETGALVAAGALVPPRKIVKAGELWAGNPAQFMRPVNDAERHILTTTPEKYRALAQEHRQTHSDR